MARNKFDGMTTVDYLYRYVFRGIGIVFWAGVITGLIVTVNQFLHLKYAKGKPAVPTHQSRGIR